MKKQKSFEHAITALPQRMAVSHAKGKTFHNQVQHQHSLGHNIIGLLKTNQKLLPFAGLMSPKSGQITSFQVISA